MFFYNVSSDFFREVGSVWEFLTLSGRLFHTAGAYDLVALPLNRIVFKSLGFGRTRRDCSCCLLFVLNDGTSPRQIPVHVFISFANECPCILVSTRKPTLTHLVSVNLAEWRKKKVTFGLHTWRCQSRGQYQGESVFIIKSKSENLFTLRFMLEEVSEKWR